MFGEEKIKKYFMINENKNYDGKDLLNSGEMLPKILG